MTKLLNVLSLSAAVLALAVGCTDSSSDSKGVASSTTTSSSSSGEGARAPVFQAGPVDVASGSSEGVVAEPPTVVDQGPVEPPSLLSLESLHHEEIGRDFVGEGDQLMDEGKPAEAVIAYRHALYDDDSPGVWMRLGRAYLKSEQTDRGVAALEESVTRGSREASVHEQLAQAYLKRGDGEKARSHVERLLKRDSKSASYQYLAGRTYMKLSMWAEAVDAFGKSLDAEPGNIWAHNNLGYSALQIGETELAVTHLEHTLDLPGLKPYMLNNLGVAYERQARGPEAAAAFSYAIELQPGYVNGVINKQRVEKGLTEEEMELSAALLQDLKSPSTDTAVASAEGSVEGSAEPVVGE